MAKIEIEIPEGKLAKWVNGVLTLIDDTSKEPNEVIKNYYDAADYINSDYKAFVKVPAQHYEALAALNQLFIIAETWNKEDGFVPDFSNSNQDKYCPWFRYDKDAVGFVYVTANSSPTYADARIGSRLCFKSQSRAEQFGKQFAHLYNKVFLP